jgi:carbon-monoxide dehydrogenase medium subunit
MTAVNPVNTKVPDAEQLLVGQAPSDELFEEAGELAARASEPRTDVRGSAEWKRHVVRVFTRRALTAAASSATS